MFNFYVFIILDKKNDRGGVHARLAMVDKSKKTSAEQPTYQVCACVCDQKMYDKSR